MQSIRDYHLIRSDHRAGIIERRARTPPYLPVLLVCRHVIWEQRKQMDHPDRSTRAAFSHARRVSRAGDRLMGVGVVIPWWHMKKLNTAIRLGRAQDALKRRKKR